MFKSVIYQLNQSSIPPKGVTYSQVDIPVLYNILVSQGSLLSSWLYPSLPLKQTISSCCSG